MKTLTKSALVAAMLASGVAMAAVPPGAGPGNCQGRSFHHAHAFQHHRGGGIERMMAKMVENRKQLRTVMNRGTYDEAKVQQLAQAQGNLKAEMIVLRTKTQSQIRNVLTDQQREQLQQMRTRHGFYGHAR